MVAQVFCHLAQGANVDIAIDANGHHIALRCFEAYFGLFDVVGKGANEVDGLIDVLKCFHAVGASNQFDGDIATSFAGL